MSQQNQNDERETSNTIKDPDEWTTGDEPMTGAQESYLKTLSDEAGEDAPGGLTKAEASKHIESLQRATGRGLDNNGPSPAADDDGDSTQSGSRSVHES